MNNSMFTKKEAEILLRSWVRDRAEYYYRKDDDVSIEHVVDEVFDLMVDCWINQPVLLQACRAANFDKKWIRKNLLGIREEIEEKKKNEAIEIVKDRINSTQLSMPPEANNSPPVSDGRIMMYSFSTLDGELDMMKSRTVGARDKKKRQSHGLSVPDKHKINIALKTLKMPDAMLGVMGGMTKEEAKSILGEYIKNRGNKLLTKEREKHGLGEIGGSRKKYFMDAFGKSRTMGAKDKKKRKRKFGETALMPDVIAETVTEGKEVPNKEWFISHANTRLRSLFRNDENAKRKLLSGGKNNTGREYAYSLIRRWAKEYAKGPTAYKRGLKPKPSIDFVGTLKDKRDRLASLAHSNDLNNHQRVIKQLKKLDDQISKLDRPVGRNKASKKWGYRYESGK